MSTAPGFETKHEVATNRLTLRFSGHMDASLMEACSRQVAAMIELLQPQFTLFVDLSGLELMDFDCVPFIEKIMDLCSQRKIGSVVRVVPQPAKDIGFIILSRFHYPRSVRLITCETMEEAERVLATL